jgi:tripartite-type tricarboxylate transporter receptor subunit TctC
MSFSRRLFITTSLLAPAVLRAPHVFAQDYPVREIHVICAYAPGTGADTLVRYLAEKLRVLAGKPMIVENKPGAGTSIAAQYVAHAKPDGYTLFLNPGNGMAGNVYLYKNLGHDVINDFAPITTLVKLPFVLAVPPASPAKSVAELIALLKEKGNKAFYGAPTNLARAAGELLNERAGLQAVPVPYKSTVEAMNDLNRGFIDYIWTDATFALGLARQDKLRVLAVTTQTRSSLDPEIPTLQEAGVGNFHLEAWWGAWFPAKTPQPIVDQMAAWLNQIIADPETRQFLATSIPSEPFPGDPASLLAYLKDDIPRWAEAYRLSKIEPQ